MTMSNRLKWAAVTAAVIVPIAGAGFATAAPADITDAKAVAVQAMTSEQDSFIPASVKSAAQALPSVMTEVKVATDGNTPLLTESLGNALDNLNSGAVTTADSEGQARLARLFVGPAKAKVDQEHANGVASISAAGDPNFRPLDGGVRNVTWTSESKTGDQIVLQGVVTFWAKLASRNSESGNWQVTSPAQDCTVSLTLTKSGGTWKVQEYVWHFVPGQEP